MTDFQLKKEAARLFEKAMGIHISTTKIVLLEANTDGSYIFFAVGNCSYAYYRLHNTFAVYPNREGRDGMRIEL